MEMPFDRLTVLQLYIKGSNYAGMKGGCNAVEKVIKPFRQIEGESEIILRLY